ncbi:coiled-coil domain-containing protein 57 isoform X2 [Epinephelus fuscoguttatus]|uniref:coiled-coil domain-containing protein 57 isoform X2 n=1 Tax=Epinephelus fuscoguttatus TaxID=293821 RepID=UPI0020D084B6|nr:coiled-coil domain-containing protein 57 isoform X2 [Epinephelus fuscoguttatus]
MVYPSSAMQSDGDSGLVDLEAQLASKEREWKELLAARVHQLESSLQQAQEEYSSLRERYQQLREDFQFNLAILDERDRELERYDVITAKALTVEHNRQGELNQLCMQVAQLERQRARETQERQEELRLQLDTLKSSMAGEIQKQTEEYDRMKQDLQSRIQEMEGELILQRQEMTAAFDSELRQREHEFNIKIDEMCALVLSHDLKVKLLSKETEVHCHAQHQTAEALKASKEFCQQIQTQLQHKDQEIKHLTNVKDNKYANVVQTLMECDGQLEVQYQALTEQLQKAERHVIRLQGSIDILAACVCCIQEDHREAMKKKDETIQSYKQQLSVGLKRERALEQMQVQIELEWQRRCEDMKVQCYHVNEQLIQDLTKARDQVKAELKEKEQDLQDLTVLLRSVQTERDQAVQGLTPKIDSLASEEIRCLQQQNSILRAVVNQMRKDMEGLTHPQAQPQASSPQTVQHSEAPAAKTQMATGLPTQSTDISFKVSAPGGLSQEKDTNASALAKQEVRMAHMESALASLMEQSALVGQLREENLYLPQQQASSLKYGSLFENVQSAKSNTRLKQAASRIARLSREKQQLIEIGNRLRAQITTAGPQEPLEPERDLSTEKQGDHHDGLIALEQLQYQLTSQELQYALRQRAGTFAEQLLLGKNSPDSATKGAANPWCKGFKITDRPESSKNKENKLSQSQSSMDVGLQPNSGLSMSHLSSVESQQSLKELWDILDHGASLSIFSEGEAELSRREMAESGGAEVQMTVHGIKAPIHSQFPTEVQQKRNPSETPSNTARTSRPGSTGRSCKIRNYSVKV